MQDRGKRSSIILGVFMVFVLLVSAIVPLLTQNIPATNTTQVDPTDVPTPTFPPPVAPQAITLDQLYLHPSALFTVAQPTGWQPQQPLTEPNRASVTMVNSDALSVIETTVEDPAGEITTEGLGDYYNPSYLETSWRSYSDWTETARRSENDRLVLDFNLTLNRQTYVARQTSWTDGDWVYMVRVVAPSNAVETVRYLIENLPATLSPNKQFVESPFGWNSHYDRVWSHIIRYPIEWTVQDTNPGRPTSIVSFNGATLRVQAEANRTLASEDEASAWVQAIQPNAEILSVQPVERGDASGFQVAYAFRTVDGEPQSGGAVLLNGPDGNLHSANLRFPAENIDLNAEAAAAEATPEATAAVEATAEAESTAEATPEIPVFVEPEPDYSEYESILASFRLLPPLNLAPDPNATPTPLPTEVPVSEATAEATGDATATEEAGEATAEAETEATEAAGEATAETETEATEAAEEEVSEETETAEPTAEATEAG